MDHSNETVFANGNYLATSNTDIDLKTSVINSLSSELRGY